MLSQLTLRFPKKLIERLKNRAATENTSVNALAERLMETSLKGSTVTDDYVRLATDPDTTIRQLYRRVILGETFGQPGMTRAELKFFIVFSHEAYNRGPGFSQLVRIPVLRTLLDITFELLRWQVANGQPVDSHYLKSTFALAGEDWDSETARFMDSLPAAVTCGQAELWLRPLAGFCFDLALFPDEALAAIFTTARLKILFPLLIHARGWEWPAQEAFVKALQPRVTAVTENLTAGALQMEVRIEGQQGGRRAAAWYDTPRLYLVMSGTEFIMPFGWQHFSELLRALQVYRRGPELLPRGYHGHSVMFSPPGNAGSAGFIGLDALRVFMDDGEFDQLITQLVEASEQGPLATALEDLRCIYGDL